jgi:hypothetical protein
MAECESNDHRKPIRAATPEPDGTTDTASTLIAYRVSPLPPLRLVAAPQPRAWMEATDQRFANRCLPLLIANQAGWFLLNSHAVRATWDGGNAKEALRLEYLSGAPPYPATSHFGHGILTWHIPYLFRTPPGYNLLARGPANWPKEGAFALEGIVETDWSVATFTMNWKLTAVGRPVMFEVGEPVCMLVPQRRGDLEAFEPQVRDLQSEPELSRAYQQWTETRARFLADLQVPESEAVRQLWQKHYFRGTGPDGSSAPTHQTKLHLREFDDPDGWCPF